MSTPEKRIFVDVEHLETQLQRMDRGIVVTRGYYETRSPGEARDLDWNHMDPHHRQYIHHTYGKSVRLCTGPDFQLSLTKYGGLPFLLPVADIRIRPGLFYQCFSVFSLVSIIAVLHTTEHQDGADQRIDWFIVSKRIWKFLHPWLNTKMARLNRVQNAEDEPIRRRRAELRARGFRFKTDVPDYVNASSLAWHLLPPELNMAYAIPLAVPTSELQRVQAGPLVFLYTSDGAGGVHVWPEACPHEGASLENPIEKSEACLKCPWHGLEIRGVRLTPGAPPQQCQGASLHLKDGVLNISPAAVANSAEPKA